MCESNNLTQEEKHIFDNEFYNFVHSNYPEITHEVMYDNKDIIIHAIIRTKYGRQADFGGIFPSTGDFGWSFPHPIFFFQDKNTWINQYKKGSWTIWIDKDLYGSSSTFLLLGFYCISKTDTCNISSVYVESDGITFPPLWIKNIINEFRVYILPKPILTESILKIKTLSESDSICELIPLGIYFGNKLYEASFRQPQPKIEKRA